MQSLLGDIGAPLDCWVMTLSLFCKREGEGCLSGCGRAVGEGVRVYKR